MRRLLLVDDHASSRQPLALLLSLALEFDEILQAGGAAEAMAFRGDEPDVAVVDLGLPDGDGVSLIRWMQTAMPGTRSLVLTSSSDRTDAARAIAAGARGVVHKAADIDEIVAAVRAIDEGQTLVTDRQRAEVAALDAEAAAAAHHEPAGSRQRLTPREQDVLALLAAGLSDKEIAVDLRIGVGTVRTHLAGLYGKLDAQSRLQAVNAARRRGLIDDPER